MLRAGCTQCACMQSWPGPTQHACLGVAALTVLFAASPMQVEAQVLFRALRDFNIPKILAQVGPWGAADGACRQIKWSLLCIALYGAGDEQYSKAGGGRCEGKPPISSASSSSSPLGHLASHSAQDMVIFSGLLSDLFPGVDPPRKRDMDFEAVIRATTK